MTNLLERIKALESTLYYAGITVRTPITQADLDEYVMSRLEESGKVVNVMPQIYGGFLTKADMDSGTILYTLKDSKE